MFTLPDTEIDTDTDKNDLHRIVLRGSYCTETDENTDCRWVCVLVIGIGLILRLCECTIMDEEIRNKFVYKSVDVR